MAKTSIKIWMLNQNKGDFTPQNGWKTYENPIKIDGFGGKPPHYFWFNTHQKRSWSLKLTELQTPSDKMGAELGDFLLSLSSLRQIWPMFRGELLVFSEDIPVASMTQPI